MKKKILISANPFEIKVAVLDKGDLVEFHVERKKEVRGVAGDIYKGKVVRVLPGMQAAFVDIGLERTAFLHATDIYESLDEFEFPINLNKEAHLLKIRFDNWGGWHGEIRDLFVNKIKLVR